MSNQAEERRRLFERAKDELVSGQKVNAEQFDRSVLTLSTAFLALSMSFIREVVPSSEMILPYLLYASWFGFAASILLTLFGLLYGQRLFKTMIDAAERYYIQNDQDAFKVSEVLPRRLDRLNWAVGITFAGSVLCNVLFVIKNMGLD